MKKIIVLLAIIIFPYFVFAKEIKVDDINLELDLNEDYIVLTRDNLEGNEDLSRLNIPEDYMKQTMKDNNIYLDIIKNDISYEILVVVPDITLTYYNLANATSSMLDELRNELVRKTGAEISSVYKGVHDFIMVDYYDKNTKYYIVNYYTVVNAKGYNIQLQKKSEITDEEKDELKEIVNSVSIKVIDNYKNEKSSNIENNNSFSIKNIIIGAIVGAAVGLISYFVSINTKKKKAFNEENKSEEKNTKKSSKKSKNKKVLNIDETVSNEKK